jgi:hypothetical protein
MNALVVGHAEPAAALTSALTELHIEAELLAPARPPEAAAVAGLAESLVDLERRLTDAPPALAVAVGTDDASLALAITAAKLRVPLAGWVDAGSGDGDLAQAEARIITTLADLECDGAGPAEAAARIASWANLELDA